MKNGASGYTANARVNPVQAVADRKDPRQLSAFRAAESSREIDDKSDQQNQAKSATADDWAAKVKPAAAEQEKQNHHE